MTIEELKAIATSASLWPDDDDFGILGRALLLALEAMHGCNEWCEDHFVEWLRSLKG